MTAEADRPPTPDRERSGAHRPRRSPFVELAPVLLVLLVLAIVGAGVWQLNRSTADTVAASSGPGDGADAGTGDGSTPSPSTTTATSPVSTSSATSTLPAPSLDRSTQLSVLNATTRSGLAAAAARVLRAAGWTVQTGNERSSQGSTTVYYPRSAQQATAQAVADDLGGSPRVERSSRFGTDRVTVVLAGDYAG